MQLSTSEEKTKKHDEAFKHLEEVLHHLQKPQTDGDHELPKQKPKSHKSPHGLSVSKYYCIYSYSYMFIVNSGLCKESSCSTRR